MAVLASCCYIPSASLLVLRWTQKNDYFLSNPCAPLMKLLPQCCSILAFPLLPTTSSPFPLRFSIKLLSTCFQTRSPPQTPHSPSLLIPLPLPLSYPLLCLPPPFPSFVHILTFISCNCRFHPKPHCLSLEVLLHPNYQVNPCCDRALTSLPFSLPDLETPQTLPPSSILFIKRSLMAAVDA